MGGRLADVGQYAETHVSVPKYELDRFPRIMRHGEGLDLDVPDGDCGVAVDQVHVRERRAHPIECLERAVGKIDRETVAGGKARDAADMIVVLVGHDYRIEVFRSESAPAQSTDGFIEAETAI